MLLNYYVIKLLILPDTENTKQKPDVDLTCKYFSIALQLKIGCFTLAVLLFENFSDLVFEIYVWVKEIQFIVSVKEFRLLLICKFLKFTASTSMYMLSLFLTNGESQKTRFKSHNSVTAGLVIFPLENAGFFFSELSFQY